MGGICEHLPPMHCKLALQQSAEVTHGSNSSEHMPLGGPHTNIVGSFVGLQ